MRLQLVLQLRARAAAARSGNGRPSLYPHERHRERGVHIATAAEGEPRRPLDRELPPRDGVVRGQAETDPVAHVVADRVIVPAHHVMRFGAQRVELEAGRRRFFSTF